MKKSSYGGDNGLMLQRYAESVASGIAAHPWIAVLAVALAIAAVGFVIVTLFYPAEADNRTLVPTGTPAAGSQEFIDMLAGLTNTPVENGPPPRIVNNGDEFVPALIERIEAAERSVNLTTFIWTEGEMSDRIFDALITAAKRGVAVRVLVDGFGGAAPEDRVEELAAAGGRFEEYSPITLSKVLEYYKRTHRRAFVIDGRYAFVGGIAVSDEWLGDGRSATEWRELMIEVEGTPARSVQNAFADIWTETTGEVLTGEAFYPDTAGDGDAIYLHIVSSPAETSQSIRASLLLSVLAATDRLYITNPYLLLDDQTMEALKERATAGVDVRILVPGLTGLSPVLMAQEVNYGPLLAAGVRIYEYEWYVHSKTLTADGTWSMVGSANIDSRSRVLNDENVLGVAHDGFAARLEEAFMADLDHAHELTLDDWEQRPLWRRIGGRLSYLFAKQY